jgi:competence protein ComEC
MRGSRAVAHICDLVCLSVASFAPIAGASAAAEEAHIRVVDVGAGLCVVATAPGGHAMVYDTGAGSTICAEAVAELVPSGWIDLMVLSHSDIDHIGAAQKILADYRVSTIIHPGDERPQQTIQKVREAIEREPGADVWNLATRPVPFGRQFMVGDATVTFVAGWSDPRSIVDADPSLDGAGHVAERNNGVSLVVRFAYHGHSVLLTGDTLGRIENYKRPDDTLCQYAERKMVANDAAVPLKSDVLIGQHHGSDDSTSNCFIRAVRPEWVVFSAGHEYRHPRQSTADRLMANGVDKDHMLRTDRGDYEPVKAGQGRLAEWVYGSLKGCVDKPGDDDIDIRLSSDPAAMIDVRYRDPKAGC